MSFFRALRVYVVQDLDVLALGARLSFAGIIFRSLNDLAAAQHNSRGPPSDPTS